MKKAFKVLGMGVLCLSLLSGCSNPKKVNPTIKTVDSVGNKDILLINQKGYGMQREWSNAKDSFMLNNLVDGKIHFYKNNKLAYSINNGNGNERYNRILLNTSGNNFMGEKVDRNKKHWQLDLFTSEDGTKKLTYFQDNQLYHLEKWDDQGIFLTKSVSWEEMDGVEQKLYLLTPNNQIKEVWNFQNKPYVICDIMDNWVLLRDYKNFTLHKYNLSTKEIKNINLEYGKTELNVVYFYGSVNGLVGEIVEDNKYKVFLFENNQKRIITEGQFVGMTDEGIIYKKLSPNSQIGEGDIYLRLLK